MRETRPSGSVRGVRSNPYPYRDNPPPDAVGGEILAFPPIPHSNPAPKARTSPYRAGIATLPGRQSAAEPQPETAGNRSAKLSSEDDSQKCG
jgi:hypothetical protein